MVSTEAGVNESINLSDSLLYVIVGIMGVGTTTGAGATTLTVVGVSSTGLISDKATPLSDDDDSCCWNILAPTAKSRVRLSFLVCLGGGLLLALVLVAVAVVTLEDVSLFFLSTPSLAFPNAVLALVSTLEY